jgi:ABC-type transport system involved in multi-copper enzyme maturation permease subunit
MTHWGPGPVFFYEWLVGSRRWQGYASRSLFVSMLLLGLLVVQGRWGLGDRVLPSHQALARLARLFFDAIIVTQVTLLLLIAPAMTAGAICLDKTRGTLTHVLVTDLTDTEIALGKLSARLLPLFGLLACVLPVTALLALMGGVELRVMFGAFLVSLGITVLGGTLGLVFSVWARRMHEALLAGLGVWAICLLGYPMSKWLEWQLGWAISWGEVVLWINPFWQALGPMEWPGEVSLGGQTAFLGVTLALSAGLAAARVRAVATRQLDSGRRQVSRRVWRALAYLRREVRWLTGPSLDINAVAWREWHRRAPTRAGLFLRRAYAALLVLLLVLALLRSEGLIETRLGLVSGVLTTLCLLMLGISAATSLTEERARGSLDVLLATPLSTRSIVWGKWWGTFRTALPLVIPPYMIAHVPTWQNYERWQAPWIVGGLLLIHAAMVTGLGLGLATLLRRTDRAVVSFVVIYLGVAIGLLFLPFAFFDRGPDNPAAAKICMASPLFAVVAPTAGAENPGLPDDLWHGAIDGAVVWLLIGSTVAAALFAITLASFDACLGRVTDRRLPQADYLLEGPRPLAGTLIGGPLEDLG